MHGARNGRGPSQRRAVPRFSGPVLAHARSTIAAGEQYLDTTTGSPDPLDGHGGSVTVRNWFDGASKRVERVEFADGSAWDEDALRARASANALENWWHQGWGNDCGDERRWSFDGRGHRRALALGTGDEADETRDSRLAIAAWLAREARFDFGAVADFLRREAGRQGGPVARERIAHQWRAVQIAAAHIDYADDGVSVLSRPLAPGSVSTFHAAGWGHASSTGWRAAFAGMQTFAGLSEGFEKLG